MASVRQEGEQMKRYTVYNDKTDEVVIVDGTAHECAKAMGIERNSFYHFMWKNYNGENTKWSIIVTEDVLPNNPTFGDLVRHHRIKQNMKPGDLAKKAGISVQSVYAYETKRTEPVVSVAAQIAKALGLSLDDLVQMN